MNTKAKLAIVLLVVIVVVALLLYSYSSTGSNLVAFDNQPIPVSQYLALKAIATNTALASAVGQGAIGAFPQKISGTPLIIGGKPAVVYVGAEFCPYCAATRWGLIIALLRFGNFTNLQYMTSSATDIDASTPTFTFYNATYESSAINFTHAEYQTNTGAPLQVLTHIENITFNTYDTVGIPFIDFGNRTIQSGANFSPKLLDGYNWAQIIGQLNDTNSTISQAVIGSANIFTAQICYMTSFTPSSVCNAPYVKQVLSGSGISA